MKGNGVVVMPTDTIYGIVARAENEQAVRHVYFIRKRSPDKPCVMLVGDINQVEKFSVILSEKQKEKISGISEGMKPMSFVVDCPDDKFEYLHRGAKTLAFRLPAPAGLRELLRETGPLIAPSANTEGLPPAENIIEAKKYFGDEVDLYVDGGEIKGKASKIIRLHEDGSATIIRE